MKEKVQGNTDKKSIKLVNYERVTKNSIQHNNPCLIRYIKRATRVLQ